VVSAYLNPKSDDRNPKEIQKPKSERIARPFIRISSFGFISGFGFRPSDFELNSPAPMNSTSKPTVLILCTGNACRSQMAEGILRAAAGDIVNVQSAGSGPAGYVHPLAINVMAEIGIYLSGHRSKHLDEFLNQPVHTVITVCGNADAACPIFPGQVERHHWPFDDPAKVTGTEEEVLVCFRRVRDEMRKIFGAYADGLRGVVKTRK
jgi:arsenate reductase